VFEKTLSTSKTERKINTTLELTDNDCGYKLTVTDEDNYSVSSKIDTIKEISQKNETDKNQIEKQLSKLGGTIFKASDIRILLTGNYFIPVSMLNDLRREAVEKLLERRISDYQRIPFKLEKTENPYPYKKIDFRHNVSNHLAEQFYRKHGVEVIEKSFETSDNHITGPLMTTKLCLKYENNLCPKQNSKNRKFKEPFYLVEGNAKYRIEFDCTNCFMLIFKDV